MSELTTFDATYIQSDHAWTPNTMDTRLPSSQKPSQYSQSRASKVGKIWASGQAQHNAIARDRESHIEQWKKTQIRRVREAADAERLTAEARFSRQEALARLSDEGLAAHWSASWQHEADRARSAAVAGEMDAQR